MMGVLTISVDKRDPRRLRLRGDARGSALDELLDRAVALLATPTPWLIVDVAGVTAAGTRLVGVLNELARDAALLHKTLVIEVPEDRPEWFDQATLNPTIRLERTRLVQAPAERANAVAPAQRRGRGFVASYGEHRRCAAAGCSTTLSRYNSEALCSLHFANARSRRG